MSYSVRAGGSANAQDEALLKLGQALEDRRLTTSRRRAADQPSQDGSQTGKYEQSDA